MQLHPHIGRMELLVRDHRTPRESKARLHFALGLIYDRQGRWEEAFSHITRANKCREKRFRPRAASSEADRRIAAFSSERINELSRHGSQSDAVVFVVGMPRSGTTLIEQVLDAHPDITGLGERLDIYDAVRTVAERLRWARTEYPECLEFLSPEIIEGLSEEILGAFMKAAPGARRVVTKRPNDFWELGFIHILFPRARIIHCRRHPADTCLSCYMQDFLEIPYASRLEHLAAYYRQYERIMSHWYHTIPPHTIYPIEYEQMVSDSHTSILDVLKACGVEYSEECLAFFTNTRQIKTASMWQVREPIYKRSVGRWKNYQQFLGPLGGLASNRLAR
jgi:hypothetical protein